MTYKFTEDSRHWIEEMVSVFKAEHSKNAVNLWLSDIKDEVDDAQLNSLRQLTKNEPNADKIQDCIEYIVECMNTD